MIKGHCQDCYYRMQEWVTVEDENGQRRKINDFYCGMCDVFKRPDGFCDFFEPR